MLLAHIIRNRTNILPRNWGDARILCTDIREMPAQQKVPSHSSEIHILNSLAVGEILQCHARK
jgi:hypothetical protein